MLFPRSGRFVTSVNLIENLIDAAPRCYFFEASVDWASEKGVCTAEAVSALSVAVRKMMVRLLAKRVPRARFSTQAGGRPFPSAQQLLYVHWNRLVVDHNILLHSGDSLRNHVALFPDVTASDYASPFVQRLNQAGRCIYRETETEPYRRELRDLAAEYGLEVPPDIRPPPSRWTLQTYFDLNWWFFFAHSHCFWPSAHSPLTLGMTREELPHHDASRTEICALPARFNGLEVGFLKSLVHADKTSHRDPQLHADKLRSIAHDLGLRINF